MRIIGGEHGGRKINPPSKMPYTRPTTDLAKEGLFNILENNLELPELKTLDLFGGTGSISYELASRGVPELTIVEKDQAMFDFIRNTVTSLKFENIKVVKMDVFRFIQQSTEKFNLIFAGPPYALETIDELPKLVFEKQLLEPKGWFILEHTPRNNYEKLPWFVTERKYGTTIFSIFVNRETT
jgi:16S rRNA (guanine966-N2)-methyltransferase